MSDSSKSKLPFILVVPESDINVIQDKQKLFTVLDSLNDLEAMNENYIFEGMDLCFVKNQDEIEEVFAS